MVRCLTLDASAKVSPASKRHFLSFHTHHVTLLSFYYSRWSKTGVYSRRSFIFSLTEWISFIFDSYCRDVCVYRSCGDGEFPSWGIKVPFHLIIHRKTFTSCFSWGTSDDATLPGLSSNGVSRRRGRTHAGDGGSRWRRWTGGGAVLEVMWPHACPINHRKLRSDEPSPRSQPACGLNGSRKSVTPPSFLPVGPVGAESRPQRDEFPHSLKVLTLNVH